MYCIYNTIFISIVLLRKFLLAITIDLKKKLLLLITNSSFHKRRKNPNKGRNS